MTDFGSGPALSSNFDFDIDATGDIRTVSGVKELEKDLAVRVATIADNVVGEQFDAGDKEDLRISLGRAIAADERISSVLSIDITQQQGSKFELDVTVDTIADDGPFDLVIPV